MPREPSPAGCGSRSDSLDAPIVVYGVDPLCGWCFAIGDALRQARAELGDSVRWQVALGGLVTGERVRPVRNDAEYLRGGMVAVERASGRRPGAAYWDDVVTPGTWVSDSEPAVRAVLAVRDLADDDTALVAAHLLCDGLYLDGRTPDDPQQIASVGETCGIDGDALVSRWQSDEGRAAVSREYARARALGVTTYPSLFVKAAGGDDARLHPVLAGYAPASTIVAEVRRAMRTRS